MDIDPELLSSIPSICEDNSSVFSSSKKQSVSDEDTPVRIGRSPVQVASVSASASAVVKKESKKKAVSSPDLGQCCAITSSKKQCSRGAKVTSSDGKSYCTQHSKGK